MTHRRSVICGPGVRRVCRSKLLDVFYIDCSLSVCVDVNATITQRAASADVAATKRPSGDCLRSRAALPLLLDALLLLLSLLQQLLLVRVSCSSQLLLRLKTCAAAAFFLRGYYSSNC